MRGEYAATMGRAFQTELEIAGCVGLGNRIGLRSAPDPDLVPRASAADAPTTVLRSNEGVLNARLTRPRTTTRVALVLAPYALFR